MGADLYIKSLYDARRAKYEGKFNNLVQKRDEVARSVEAWKNIVKAREITAHLPSGGVHLKNARETLFFVKKQLQFIQANVEKAYNLAFCGPGYFRESYSGGGVLNQMGLSWWKDVRNGKQTRDSLIKFWFAIWTRKLNPVTATELRERGCTVDNDKNSILAWRRMYRNKKRRLLRFLNRAIIVSEQGGEVYFSL